MRTELELQNAIRKAAEEFASGETPFTLQGMLQPQNLLWRICKIAEHKAFTNQSTPARILASWTGNSLRVAECILAIYREAEPPESAAPRSEPAAEEHCGPHAMRFTDEEIRALEGAVSFWHFQASDTMSAETLQIAARLICRFAEAKRRVDGKANEAAS